MEKLIRTLIRRAGRIDCDAMLIRILRVTGFTLTAAFVLDRWWRELSHLAIVHQLLQAAGIQ